MSFFPGLTAGEFGLEYFGELGQKTAKDHVAFERWDRSVAAGPIQHALAIATIVKISNKIRKCSPCRPKKTIGTPQLRVKFALRLENGMAVDNV